MRRQQRISQEQEDALQAAQAEARRQYETVPVELRNQAPVWKEGHRSVFAISVLDKWYVIRGLELGEAQTFMEIVRSDLYSGTPLPSNTLIAQEFLVSTALLHPKDLSLDKMLQGEVSSLCGYIWTCSGFSDLEVFFGAIDEARVKLQSNADDAITAFICKAFGMSPGQVMKLDMRTLTRYLAMAEMVLGTELPLQLKGSPMSLREQQELALQQSSSRYMRIPPAPQAGIQPGIPPGIPQRAVPQVEPGVQPGITPSAQPAVAPDMQSGKRGSIDMDQENAELRKFMTS